MPQPDTAERLARDQHGVLTRRQARRAGVADTTISRRVRSGRWQVLHRGVFLVGPPTELLTQLTAARLHAGDGLVPAGVVAGLAAARLWGLDDGRLPCRPELILPRTIRRPQPTGIRFRWTPIGIDEVARRAGLPCCAPRRVVADLTRRADFAEVLVLADAALRTGCCTPRDLAALAGLAPRGGRRALLAADHRAESAFESRVRAELLAAGLPPPVLQYEVRSAEAFVARVDFAWPRARLVVEADGAATHASAPALRADLRRQNLLVALGWTVLRFTWSDLGWIAPVVAAALARAGQPAALRA